MSVSLPHGQVWHTSPVQLPQQLTNWHPKGNKKSTRPTIQIQRNRTTNDSDRVSGRRWYAFAELDRWWFHVSAACRRCTVPRWWHLIWITTRNNTDRRRHTGCGRNSSYYGGRGCFDGYKTEDSTGQQAFASPVPWARGIIHRITHPTPKKSTVTDGTHDAGVGVESERNTNSV